jgi:YD repeat-containing protein
VTNITYDNLNRKIGMNDPDMGIWEYGYDNNGNLTWQKDANGQVITFQYDALNRLKNKNDAITGPTPKPATFNVDYKFDELSQSYAQGRLSTVAYTRGKAVFVYDKLGREISSNKTVEGTTYTVKRAYNALNNLTQLQYPDGAQVNYTFNPAGQISRVADAASGGQVYIKAVDYNAQGQITQIQ